MPISDPISDLQICRELLLVASWYYKTTNLICARTLPQTRWDAQDTPLDASVGWRDSRLLSTA